MNVARLRRSLRIRLAVAGFAVVYLPVLLLWAVVFVTATEEISFDEQPFDQVQRQESNGPDTSPWVLATVLALAPVAAVGAWVWAGRAVEPLNRIRASIDEITGGDLDRRLGVTSGPEEIVALASSFDGMLARLQTAAELQTRLIDEASHELRTPLTVLVHNAEVALADPDPSTEGYVRALERSRDTSARLTRIVEDLLVDARAKARALDRHPVDVVEVCRRAVGVVAPLADVRGVAIDLVAPGPLVMAVDSSSMTRAVTNLIDNAVRYSPSDGVVHISIEGREQETLIDVVDSGPGVPEHLQRRVFERFARAGDDGGGTGLGLPIATQVVEAHGGTLELTSPGPSGRGSLFRIRLPSGPRSEKETMTTR